MKRLLAMFVLTPREQRLVIFTVLALVVGASIKHQREKRLNEVPVDRSTETSPSPELSPTPSQR